MDTPTPVRVRFAPSPTGFLHLGGARTALYNWLYARKMHGTFILRIEDTDEVRSTPAAISAIIDGLHWLGLDWDEGPIPDSDNSSTGKYLPQGNYAPYFQIERYHAGIYQPYIDQLLAEGKAYQCYCTPEELELQRQDALRRKLPPKYIGRCRNLTIAEKQSLTDQGRNFSIRLKIPSSGTTSFVDLIRGEVKFENLLLDDFIIVKASGIPTYNFAVVIDDYLMKITHVLRGDDHISNTPRQLILYQLLNWTPPVFVHFPMIHGADGTRLSKRHGAVAVTEYRTAGYLPAALINYLVLLGWSTEDSQQVFALPELIDKFSLDRCGKSAAVFDPKKLLWLNGLYLRQLSLDEIMQLYRNYELSTGNNPLLNYWQDSKSYEYIRQALNLEKDKIKLLADIPNLIAFFLDTIPVYQPEAVNKVLKKDGVVDWLNEIRNQFDSLSDFNHDVLESVVRKYAEIKGIKTSALFHPLRVAVSGRTEGPGLFTMMELLGKEKVVLRLTETINLIQQ